MPSGALSFTVILAVGMAFVIWAAMAAFPVREHRTLPSLPGVLVRHSVQIAQGEQPASDLWIVCSDQSELRLALDTRLPIAAEFSPNAAGINAEFAVLADNNRTFESIRKAPRIGFQKTLWHRDNQSDILLSPPLSQEQSATLVGSFLPAPPAVVRVDAAETGTEMRGTVDGNAISEFARRCLQN